MKKRSGKRPLRATTLSLIITLSISWPGELNFAEAQAAPQSDRVEFETISICPNSQLEPDQSRLTRCFYEGENVFVSNKHLSLGLRHRIASGGNALTPLSTNPLELRNLKPGEYTYLIYAIDVRSRSQEIYSENFSVLQRSLFSARSINIPQRLQTFILQTSSEGLIEELQQSGISVESPKPVLGSDSAVTSSLAASSELFRVELRDTQATELKSDSRVLSLTEEKPIKRMSVQAAAPWNLDRIDQTSLPLDRQFVFGAGDHSPVVYVLDTGLNETHSEFSGRVEACGYFHDLSDNCLDYEGHGTHVSGTAVGTTYGAAKSAVLVSIKITEDESGRTSDLYINEALRFVHDYHAANHAGEAAVLNLSFGGGLGSRTSNLTKAYLADLVEDGIVPVLAGGNSSLNACLYAFGDVGQAGNLGVVVGSTDRNDRISSFSNTGSCINIFAPGSSIVSAGISSTTSEAVMSGTSMAAPLVAGAIANYLSFNPSASYNQTRTWLLNNAARGQIQGNLRGAPNLLLQSLEFKVPQEPFVISNGTTANPINARVTLETSGGSGTGAVSFRLATANSNCTLSTSRGSTPVTTLTSRRATTCSIVATKASQGLFAQAVSEPKQFNFIGAQATLRISNQSRSAAVGDRIVLTTSGGSGTGLVTFNTTSENCSIVGDAANQVTASTNTTCLVTATKAGDANYAPTTSAPTSFNFLAAQAPLVISNATTTNPLNARITLQTTGGSGTGSINFSIAPSNRNCSISSSKSRPPVVTLTARLATTCTVVATKAAQGLFAQATSEPKQFVFVGP